jgi:5-methyltetrahydrofolate--homocysteine methyltransferase
VDVPPVMISGTITDRSGRTLTGQTPEAFWASVSHARPFSVGLNCALGAAEMRPHIRALSEVADTRISAYPNAGLPNEMGGYDETPRRPRASGRMGRGGAGEHRRRLLRHHARPYPRHRRGGRGQGAAAGPRAARRLRLSGLELFEADAGGRGMSTGRFINIGERTNVTGSAKFKKLIMNGDYPAAWRSRASRSRTARRSSTSTWTRACSTRSGDATFLNLIAAEPDIARVPVMIDSSKLGGDRGRAEMRAGQAGGELDQLKEGEAPFLEQARICAPLRRRRGGDGLRRGRAGRDGGAQVRHLPSAPTTC